MTDIAIRECRNFTQVVEVIEAYQEAHNTAWYRGAGLKSYKLLPSLYRHPTTKSPQQLNELEKKIASAFTQRCLPFVSQAFKDEWDLMFFMQHYGVPTRLLDWTESPFIAMYFAITSAKRSPSNIVKDDIAIWMLDPELWNRFALSDISFGGGILDSSKEQVKSFSPKVDFEERKNVPITIHGTHNSPRIVAQRGMFSLFGKSVEPMETIYKNSDCPAGVLEMIVIPKVEVDKVAKSLFRKGVSDSTVYPDLLGLSLELRRSFGF